MVIANGAHPELLYDIAEAVPQHPLCGPQTGGIT